MTGEDGSGSTIMRVTPLVGLNLAKRRFDNVMEGRGGGLITGDMRGVFRPSGGSELHSACSGYPLLLLCSCPLHCPADLPAVLIQPSCPTAAEPLCPQGSPPQHLPWFHECKQLQPLSVARSCQLRLRSNPLSCQQSLPCLPCRHCSRLWQWAQDAEGCHRLRRGTAAGRAQQCCSCCGAARLCWP